MVVSRNFNLCIKYWSTLLNCDRSPFDELKASLPVGVSDIFLAEDNLLQRNFQNARFIVTLTATNSPLLDIGPPLLRKRDENFIRIGPNGALMLTSELYYIICYFFFSIIYNFESTSTIQKRYQPS